MNNVSPGPSIPLTTELPQRVREHLARLQLQYNPRELSQQNRFDDLALCLRYLLMCDCLKRVLYGFHEPPQPGMQPGSSWEVPLLAMWQWRIDNSNVLLETTPEKLPDDPFWKGFPFVLRLELTAQWQQLSPDERRSNTPGSSIRWLNGPAAIPSLLVLQQPKATEVREVPSTGKSIIREYYAID